MVCCILNVWMCKMLISCMNWDYYICKENMFSTCEGTIWICNNVEKYQTKQENYFITPVSTLSHPLPLCRQWRKNSRSHYKLYFKEWISGPLNFLSNFPRGARYFKNKNTFLAIEATLLFIHNFKLYDCYFVKRVVSFYK